MSKTDLDQYFSELSDRHFRRMVYRLEDTIKHAGHEQYSIAMQIQILSLTQLQIVGTKPFEVELRKQFEHFYKIDKRSIFVKLSPIIDELQANYAVERAVITENRIKKLEKVRPFLLPFLSLLMKFSPKIQALILSTIVFLFFKIHSIGRFLGLLKPISFNLRFAEPLAEAQDKREIVKDLVRYFNIQRFLCYAERKLDIPEEQKETFWESLQKHGFEFSDSDLLITEGVEQLRIKISNDKLDDVFESLIRQFKDTEFLDEIILLKRRHRENEQVFNKGIEFEETYKIEKNKITKALLASIDEITNH